MTIEQLLNAGTVTPIAAGTVTSGNLVALREDGKVYAALTAAELDVANQTSTNLSLVQAQTDALGANYGVGLEVGSRAVAELGNGHAAHGYSGNGTTASTDVRVKIVDVDGSPVADVQVSTDTSVAAIHVLRISATQFAVVWQATGAFVHAKRAVLNNDGSIAAAAAFVYGDTASLGTAAPDKGTPAVNACAIGGGKFVVGFFNSAYQPRVKIYDSTSTQIGTDIDPAGAGGNIYGISFLPCQNGDFVVHVGHDGAQGGFKASRWTAAGVQVGTTQILYNTGGAYPYRGYMDDSMAEAANGNIAIACSGAGNDGYFDVKIINPGFTAIVATVDLGTSAAMEAYGSAAWPAICAQEDGNYIIVLNGSQNLLAFRFSDTTGAITQQLTSIVNAHTVAAGGYPKRLMARYLPAVGLVILSQQASSTQQEVVLLKATKQFALIGNVIALSAATADTKRGLAAELTNSGILRYQFTFGAYASIKMGAYKVLRTSLLGVAKTAATNAAVKVTTTGSHPLPAAFAGKVFTLSGRSNTVPGVSYIADGTNIQLMGV